MRMTPVMRMTSEQVERAIQVTHLRDIEGLKFEAIGEKLGFSRQRAWKLYQDWKKIGDKYLHSLAA